MSVTYLQPGVKRPEWKSYCNHICVATDPNGGMLTPERAIKIEFDEDHLLEPRPVDCG